MFVTHGSCSTGSVFGADDGYYLGEIVQADPQISATPPAFTISYTERYPQAILISLLRHVSALLSMNASTLGLLMDVIFVFVGSLVLWLMIRSYLERPLMTSLVTVFVVVGPWVLAPDFIVRTPILLSSWLTTAPMDRFPVLPVERSPFTQVSMPVFWSILLLLNSFSKQQPARRMLVAGGLSGVLLYLYFFAWVVIIPLTVLYIFFQRTRGGALSELARQVLIYATTALAVSLPGIITLVQSGATERHSIYPDVPRVFYFSFELIVAATILLVIRHSDSLGEAGRAMTSLGLATILTQFSTINLQPLTGLHFYPYHIPVFYSGPLITLSLFSLLLIWLSQILKSHKLWKQSQTACILILLASTIYHRLRNPQQALINASSELVCAVQKLVPSAGVVAIADNQNPVMTYWPRATFHREILYDPFSPKYQGEARKARFILDEMLLSDSIRNYRCNFKWSHPAEIFSTPNVVPSSAIADLCDMNLSGGHTIDESVIRDLDSLYLVSHSEDDKGRRQVLNQISVKIWEDAGGIFSLHRIDNPQETLRENAGRLPF
jgi:hypothetical protein